MDKREASPRSLLERETLIAKALRAIVDDAAGGALDGAYSGCVAVNDDLISDGLDALAALGWPTPGAHQASGSTMGEADAIRALKSAVDEADLLMAKWLCSPFPVEAWSEWRRQHLAALRDAVEYRTVNHAPEFKTRFP